MKPTTEPAEPATPAPARDAPLARLTPEQHAPILSAAAEFVAAAIQGRSASLPDPALAGGATIPVTGAYVTLKRQGHLRACCGFLGESRELIEALFHAALRTATEDHRLPPISATELPYLDLSVNLLFNLEPVQARGRDRIDAVEVGRHGLRIHRGDASGLLLPGVAVEHGWDSESFLRHVCRKAGLPTTAWEDDETVLFTFESVEFGGPFDATVLGPDGARTDGLFAPEEFRQLASHARDNLLALARGLTPNYYLPGIPDGNVSGLMLTVDEPDGDEPRHYFQLSLRPGVPLQATLFRLCEHAAQALRQALAGPRAIRVGLTVLSDSGHARHVPRPRPARPRPGATGPPGNRARQERPDLRADELPGGPARGRAGPDPAPEPGGRRSHQPGGAIDGARVRLPLGPEPRDARRHASPGRGGSVLPGRPGRPRAAGRRAARRERAPAGVVAGGHGAARGPDLLGQAGGFGVQPARDPRAGDRHRAEAHPTGGRLGRGAARDVVDPRRDDPLRPGPGARPGGGDPRPPARRRRAPARARHRGRAAVPGAARPEDPGRRPGRRRRRLGALPAIRARPGGGRPAASRAAPCWSSPAT